MIAAVRQVMWHSVGLPGGISYSSRLSPHVWRWLFETIDRFHALDMRSLMIMLSTTVDLSVLSKQGVWACQHISGAGVITLMLRQLTLVTLLHFTHEVRAWPYKTTCTACRILHWLSYNCHHLPSPWTDYNIWSISHSILFHVPHLIGTPVCFLWWVLFRWIHKVFGCCETTKLCETPLTPVL